MLYHSDYHISLIIIKQIEPTDLDHAPLRGGIPVKSFSPVVHNIQNVVILRFCRLFLRSSNYEMHAPMYLQM